MCAARRGTGRCLHAVAEFQSTNTINSLSRQIPVSLYRGRWPPTRLRNQDGHLTIKTRFMCLVARMRSFGALTPHQRQCADITESPVEFGAWVDDQDGIPDV